MIARCNSASCTDAISSCGGCRAYAPPVPAPLDPLTPHHPTSRRGCDDRGSRGAPGNHSRSPRKSARQGRRFRLASGSACSALVARAVTDRKNGRSSMLRRVAIVIGTSPSRRPRCWWSRTPRARGLVSPAQVRPRPHYHPHINPANFAQRHQQAVSPEAGTTWSTPAPRRQEGAGLFATTHRTRMVTVCGPAWSGPAVPEQRPGGADQRLLTPRTAAATSGTR